LRILGIKFAGIELSGKKVLIADDSKIGISKFRRKVDESRIN